MTFMYTVCSSRETRKEGGRMKLILHLCIVWLSLAYCGVWAGKHNRQARSLDLSHQPYFIRRLSTGQQRPTSMGAYMPRLTESSGDHRADFESQLNEAIRSLEPRILKAAIRYAWSHLTAQEKLQLLEKTIPQLVDDVHQCTLDHAHEEMSVGERPAASLDAADQQAEPVEATSTLVALRDAPTTLPTPLYDRIAVYNELIRTLLKAAVASGVFLSETTAQAAFAILTMDGHLVLAGRLAHSWLMMGHAASDLLVQGDPLLSFRVATFLQPTLPAEKRELNKEWIDKYLDWLESYALSADDYGGNEAIVLLANARRQVYASKKNEQSRVFTLNELDSLIERLLFLSHRGANGFVAEDIDAFNAFPMHHLLHLRNCRRASSASALSSYAVKQFATESLLLPVLRARSWGTLKLMLEVPKQPLYPSALFGPMGYLEATFARLQHEEDRSQAYLELIGAIPMIWNAQASPLFHLDPMVPDAISPLTIRLTMNPPDLSFDLSEDEEALEEYKNLQAIALRRLAPDWMTSRIRWDEVSEHYQGMTARDFILYYCQTDLHDADACKELRRQASRSSSLSHRFKRALRWKSVGHRLNI